MFIERSNKNPILTPNRKQAFEAEAVFNGCPVKRKKNIHLVYRAVSQPHYHYVAKQKLSVSEIGIADSTDGESFTNRRRFVVPEESWERFGCEDPRVTELDGKYYVFYTALSEHPFRAAGIKVGLAISDDLETIQEKHLITPFNAKAMALFPEKINGKFWVVLTANTDLPPSKVCLASFDREEDMWNQSKWESWYQDLDEKSLSLQRNPEDQIEIGAAPIKTAEGWLLLYSHIQNYSSGQPVFGIEAVLLDLKNPRKIIAKTTSPILTPEEYYEKIGLVPNVIFPSGAFLDKMGKINLYYGATDTTCCLVKIDLDFLLDKLLHKLELAKAKRFPGNPIISPIADHPWESKATFNTAALYLDNKVHLVYRAMSEDNTSVLGYATTTDGTHIDYRHSQPIYKPREEFEQKLTQNGNSGCEDPRLTKIGDTIYMCYTAYDGRNAPRVALTSISVKDFLAQKWNFARPVLITPPYIDGKNACIFPEKIEQQRYYFILHRIGTEIVSAFSPTLDFDGHTWIEEYRWIFPRPGMWDSKKIGIVAPPIKTESGWVLFYHGVSEDSVYRLGAILLDLHDPTKVICRSNDPIMEPETPYELEGIVDNVVFSCGVVLLNDQFYLYYGGGDRVIGVATIDKNQLLKNLTTCKL